MHKKNADLAIAGDGSAVDAAVGTELRSTACLTSPQDVPIAVIKRPNGRAEIRIALATYSPGQRRLELAKYEYRGAPALKRTARVSFAPSEIPELIEALETALKVARMEGRV